MTANRSVIAAISFLAIAGCKAETTGDSTNSSGDKPSRVVSAKKSVSAEPAENSKCPAVIDAFAKLPTDVLVGTDVQSIENFVSRNFMVGAYHAENGGSEIRLSLRETKNGLTALRSYLEPGIAEENKTYEDLCFTSYYVYGESLRVKFVEGGLLWLELASDNDFIPAELWIYLETSN